MSVLLTEALLLFLEVETFMGSSLPLGGNSITARLMDPTTY